MMYKDCELRTLLGQKEVLKYEMQFLDDRIHLLSKYHREVWFQRLWHKTKEQILSEDYFPTVKIFRDMERDLAELEKKIGERSRYLDELWLSLQPFNGRDLSKETLQQLNLF